MTGILDESGASPDGLSQHTPPAVLVSTGTSTAEHPDIAANADRPTEVDQRPLVSVVTPAYNEEVYLRECIESVLAQTYQHWDYTIVNNCSTDRTLEIAMEYAAKDKRIRVHNNETFVPVIANHNIAFRQISPLSKYCKVVAADDQMFPECLELMVGLAEQHPNVAIVCAYKIAGEKLDAGGLAFPSTVMSGRDTCRNYFSFEHSLLGAPSALLFSADVVRCRSGFYREPHLHADAEACLEVLTDRDFGFVHQILTYERRRESLSSPARSQNRFMSERLDLLKKFGPRYFDAREYQERLEALLRRYYGYLGSQFGWGRGAEFWKFHREELAKQGHPMNIGRVLIHAALSVVEGAARRLHRFF